MAEEKKIKQKRGGKARFGQRWHVLRVEDQISSVPPYNEAYQREFVRVIALSDTHCRHNQLPVKLIPAGDIFIHCGDFGQEGTLDEVTDFLSWLRLLPHKHKIVVPGNHDMILDPARHTRNGGTEVEAVKALELLSSECELLIERQIVLKLSGFNTPLAISGCSLQPRLPKGYKQMAFGLPRGLPLKDVWTRVLGPTVHVDIAATHVAPYNILDNICDKGSTNHIGCQELAFAIKNGRPAPIVHIFGHIHRSRGIERGNSTTFVNASSIINHRDLLTPRLPYIIDLAEIKDQ